MSESEGSPLRELSWEGYLNARDLGGLPTPLSSTGQTRFGRVARGPRRELVTNTGWRQAHDWGLRTIVDLRCPHEIGLRETDPAGTTSSTEGLTVVNAPTEDQDDEEFQRVCFPILDSPEYWAHNWRILPELVRNALRTVADSSPGILVHCSAGRDRTGMISTLLLSNAGVSPDAIAEDYAASVRIMAGANTHSPHVDRQTAWTDERLEGWIAACTPIVRAIAADPDSAFSAIGVDGALRRRLRSLLVD